MHPRWILIGIPCAFGTCSATTPLRAAPGVCQQVVSACVDAGFVQGGARAGNGLWKDCIGPIMQGRAQRGASLPLPRIDPRVVAVCRTSNPAFGQPKWTRDWYGTPPVGKQAPASNLGSKPTGPQKPADVAKTERPADTASSEPNAERKANAYVQPTTSPLPPAPAPNQGSEPKGSAKVADMAEPADTDKPELKPEAEGHANADAPAATSDKQAEGSSSAQSGGGPAGSTTTLSSVTSASSGPSSTASLGTSAANGATGEYTQTANLEPSTNIPQGITSFGIEIGTSDKQDGLRSLWREMLTKHVGIVTGLKARGLLASDKTWRLIAGPFSSIAEARQACNIFKKEKLKCDATAFAGDEL